MLNYIKSEWYRIVNSKELYVITVILSVLVVLFNVLLFAMNHLTEAFPYGTIRFSLSNLTNGLYILFLAGAVITGQLFSGERKNGTLKNVVAYGMPRDYIFAGKCIVTLFTSVISMIVVLACYISSACLLLEGPAEEHVQKLLCGVLVALPGAMAAVILAVALFSLCDKEIEAVLWWLAIVAFLPLIIYFAGLNFEIMRVASQWMPWNIFRTEVNVTMGSYQCLWETPSGLLRCLGSGVIWMLAYGVFGWIRVKRREI